MEHSNRFDRVGEIVYRYAVLFVGLWILTFGVALSTKADIGISPLSSAPYVLSTAWPWTMGDITIAMHIIFIAIQILLLKKKTPLNVLLQLPVAFVFGYFTDMTLDLVADMPPPTYMEALLLCILSCVFTAIGVYLEFKADVAVLAGEGLTIAFVKRFGWQFGSVKIGVDCVMTLAACLSCVFIAERFTGLREGTFISAVSVGLIIRWAEKLFPRLAEPWTFSFKRSKPERQNVYAADAPLVFSIDREYGSGGHVIGEIIAKKLGIEFYDNELIEMTAARSGLTPEYIRKNEQQLTSAFLGELYAQNYAYSPDELPPADAVFLSQSKIIRELAAQRSCVIVGRCANFILKGRPNLYSVFLHASPQEREERVVRNYGVAPERATEEMNRMDTRRRKHCRFFTGCDFGDPRAYDAVIYTSGKSPEETANYIILSAQEKTGCAAIGKNDNSDLFPTDGQTEHSVVCGEQGC